MVQNLISVKVSYFRRASDGSEEAISFPPFFMYVIFITYCTQTDLLQPVFIVLASEQLVDWLKHAFITKFNHIRPSVYERYMDVL